MTKEKKSIINQQELLEALSNMLGETIFKATSQVETMHGGTVARVFFISGTADGAKGSSHCYKMVLKLQQIWKRPNDQHSWRREYDFYTSNIDLLLTNALHIPKCYLATMNENETRLWIEYIEGYSGEELTIEMLEQVAYELGRFQGLLILKKEQLVLPENITDVTFLEKELTQWYPQTYKYEFLCSKECRLPEHVKEMLKRNPWNNESSIIYNYLRSDACDIPFMLKEMILEIDEHKNDIFEHFNKLPIVLNHRDFWIENVILNSSSISVIDWDCVGWGYLGEDIASLIGDDTLTENLSKYFHRLIPAYNRGLSQYVDNLSIQKDDILKMIFIKYGYRLIQNYMFTDSLDERHEIKQRLQTMHNI